MQKKQKIIKILNKFFFKYNLSIVSTCNFIELSNFIKKIKVFNLGYDLIRVGKLQDGGYLVPNILSKIDYCFSPGVGDKFSFEEDLIDKGIKKCFLADGTISKPKFSKKINFINKNISFKDTKKTIRLDTWIKKKVKNNNNLLLQMDIEGHEYEVLNSVPLSILNRFKIIVIEFHHLESLFTDFGLKFIKPTFFKLLESFDICHIHPNNCCGIYEHKNIKIPSVAEFTFLSKKLTKKKNKD